MRGLPKLFWGNFSDFEGAKSLKNFWLLSFDSLPAKQLLLNNANDFYLFDKKILSDFSAKRKNKFRAQFQQGCGQTKALFDRLCSKTIFKISPEKLASFHCQKFSKEIFGKFNFFRNFRNVSKKEGFPPSTLDIQIGYSDIDGNFTQSLDINILYFTACSKGLKKSAANISLKWLLYYYVLGMCIFTVEIGLARETAAGRRNQLIVEEMTLMAERPSLKSAAIHHCLPNLPNLPAHSAPR